MLDAWAGGDFTNYISIVYNESGTIKTSCDDINSIFNNSIISKMNELNEIMQEIARFVNLEFIDDIVINNRPEWLYKLFGKKFDNLLINTIKKKIKDKVFGPGGNGWQGSTIAEVAKKMDDFLTEVNKATNVINAIRTKRSTFKNDIHNIVNVEGPIPSAQLGVMLKLIELSSVVEKANLYPLFKKAEGLKVELGIADQENLKIMENINSLKNVPFSKAKQVFDELTGKIKKPVRDEIKSGVKSILDATGITAPLKIIPGKLSIPPSWAGWAIMSGISFLATDYLKHTDLLTEGDGLFLSSLFGGGGQKCRECKGRKIKKTGWHWGGPGEKSDVVAGCVRSVPRIFIQTVNDVKIRDMAPGLVVEGGNTYFVKEELPDGSVKQGQFYKVYISDFIETIEGAVIDNLPQLNDCVYSLNYGDPHWLNLDDDGNFSILYPYLLEGRNTMTLLKPVWSHAGRPKILKEVVRA